MTHPTGPLDQPGPWSPAITGAVAVADGDLSGERWPEQTATVIPTVTCPCGAQLLPGDICSCQDSWVPGPDLAPITWEVTR